jgi:hypothetical protein
MDEKRREEDEDEEEFGWSGQRPRKGEVNYEKMGLLVYRR